ncbi:hypothetical protein AAFF_G00207950 [Aldrovandia affinis]|uniref:Uncharacterized protein n=1 Tax=Aldrovandia affinis TaxID=143900 RepID=A0AAD7W565_9TELE|nr:hypothetical protein AAFF_G00207950 [Aldrovandia affinis]
MPQTLHSSTCSIWEQGGDRLHLSQTQKFLRDVQDSNCLSSSRQNRKDHRLPSQCTDHQQDCTSGNSSPNKGKEFNCVDEDVLFIMIQTGLTLEARRLLLTLTLVIDLEQDVEEDHRLSLQLAGSSADSEMHS